MREEFPGAWEIRNGMGLYRFRCPHCNEIVETLIDKKEMENGITERFCIQCGNKVLIPIIKNIQITQPIQ